jgi:hypothetical protein
VAQLFSLGHIRAMKILSGILGLLGAWIIVGNWWLVLRWYIFRKHDSLIPLFGGLLFALAMFIYPEPRVRHLAWIPFLVDLGCVVSIPGFFYAVFVLKCFKK